MTIFCVKCKQAPSTYTTYNGMTWCLKCIYSVKRHLVSDEDIDNWRIIRRTKEKLIEFREAHYSWRNMGTDWRNTWKRQFNEFFDISNEDLEKE